MNKNQTKIGLLYGKELLIDTSDEKIVSSAIRWLETLHAKAQKYDQLQLKIELDSFT